jgi:hypothetical protein
MFTINCKFKREVVWKETLSFSITVNAECKRVKSYCNISLTLKTEDNNLTKYSLVGQPSVSSIMFILNVRVALQALLCLLRKEVGGYCKGERMDIDEVLSL